MLIKKIPDVNCLVTTTVLNTKVSKFENKILGASSSVTTTVFNTKINETENKILDNAEYITTQEFDKITTESFAASLKQANLVSKVNLDNKLISLNRKITLHKTKYLEVQKNLNSLKTKDYNIFLGRLFL